MYQEVYILFGSLSIKRYKINSRNLTYASDTFYTHSINLCEHKQHKTYK